MQDQAKLVWTKTSTSTVVSEVRILYGESLIPQELHKNFVFVKGYVEGDFLSLLLYDDDMLLSDIR